MSNLVLLPNGITLALSLGFLLIILWHDIRKLLNQFFAVFLALVICWNIGSFAALAVALVDGNSSFMTLAIAIMEMGFAGASIALYSIIAVLTGVHTRRFRALAYSSLTLVLIYHLLLYVLNAPLSIEILDNEGFRYRYQLVAATYYFVFGGTSLFLIWRYRRKIQATGLFLGFNLFILSQGLGFLNPDLELTSISMTLGCVASLVISFSLLRLQIISPLADRIAQVEAMHKVSLAIGKHIQLDKVLEQIAIQAAGWLDADAACIFLQREDGYLERTAVFNLPDTAFRERFAIDEGIVGQTAKRQRSVFVENYGRDWLLHSESALSYETFGSVIAVPLVYGNKTIGVLLVIAGKQGRLFQKDDVELLELLAAQASVAISHSRLFDEQRKLTFQVEMAHDQLNTVLSSTENPVIAIDGRFRIIFANLAARRLLKFDANSHPRITDLVDSSMLPSDLRTVYRTLRYHEAYVYEIVLGEKTYYCHIAKLGSANLLGWVIVLNDVTELKELDRLKSEMVRMTSHDLKNPLQAAMANLELLTDDVIDSPNPEVHTSIEEINKQLNRMNRIISGILDLERIKDGPKAIETCHTRDFVTKVIGDMQTLARDREIVLSAEFHHNLPWFSADPEHFEHALVNLIENAIKFTPVGGHVTISCYRREDQAMFSVQDTGIGIPPELQNHVFERFWRGGQRGQIGAEHVTGTGLGLSLVKSIVDSHRGKIWLNSTLGEGTTFFVAMPLQLAKHAQTNVQLNEV